jgi:hypothetical protein
MATITAITTVEACRAVMKASLHEVGQLAPLGPKLAGYLDGFGQRIGSRAAHRCRKIRQPRCQLVGVASGEY